MRKNEIILFYIIIICIEKKLFGSQELLDILFENAIDSIKTFRKYTVRLAGLVRVSCAKLYILLYFLRIFDRWNFNGFPLN